MDYLTSPFPQLLENHRKNKPDVRDTRFLVPCGSVLWSSVLNATHLGRWLLIGVSVLTFREDGLVYSFET